MRDKVRDAERHRIWVKNNPERRNEIQRNYVERNKELVYARQREWGKANPERLKLNTYKSKYGLSGEDYRILLEKCNGACSLCLRKGVKLVVDHNHDTGHVRGLVCSPCNQYLGFVERDRTLLNRIGEYLDA